MILKVIEKCVVSKSWTSFYNIDALIIRVQKQIKSFYIDKMIKFKPFFIPLPLSTLYNIHKIYNILSVFYSHTFALSSVDIMSFYFYFYVFLFICLSQVAIAWHMLSIGIMMLRDVRLLFVQIDKRCRLGDLHMANSVCK